MKFNKEKTKKFQTGGKTPREIMEEARRNQAIERQAQTRDIVSTSGIPAYQSRPVTIQAPRQELVLKEFAPSQPVSFSQAFAEARKAELKEFIWNGERYTTDLEDNNTYDGGTLPEVVITGSKKNTNVSPPRSSSITQENSSTRVISQNPPLEKRVKSEVEDRGRNWSEVQAPNTTSYPESVPLKEFIKGPHQNFIKLYLGSYENRYKDNPTIGSRVFMTPASIGVARLFDRYYNTKSQHRSQNPRHYQQGGHLPSYQQGDKLPLRNIWERILGITPDYTPVNSQESITSYMDNTLRGPVEKRVIRKEVPYGNLHSTMSIRNPGTNRADTTFTAPSGTTYNMNDVRSGKAPSGYRYKFFEKPVGYFQQGGTIENEESGSTDQLYVDFAIRYLKAKGISEDDMVDDEGGLRDEFVEEVTTAINEVDSPDFWEQYQSNPDATVQSYIESKMEPEQIEMARKGAKLKKLKKGGMKSKKCKCGCNLTMKKEAGGTIVEVCACGCKT